MGLYRGLYRAKSYTPIMENQMENKMEHEMETAIYIGLCKGYMSYSLNSLKGGLYRVKGFGV